MKTQSTSASESTFLTAPYRWVNVDAECPHCDLTHDRTSGHVVRIDDGYWCDTCGKKLQQSAVEPADGGRTYKRYEHSNNVKMNGGFERAYDDDMVRRDEDSILEGEGITL